MVNPNATNMDAEKAYVFHTTIAKSLFLCKRERTDIQPTISLLCTRVKGPYKDDCKKLLRMIRYIKKRDYKLTLNINGMTMIE